MDKNAFVITYDVGTTGNKTCIYRIGKTLTLIDSCLVEYPLYMTDDGGAEQKVDDWWEAICNSTKTILKKTNISPTEIRGISFCCQMQGSIIVDKHGQALRNPMIYLDGRSTKQIEKFLYHGLFRVSGLNGFKTLRSLYVTGGVAGTPKDPLWKYHWVKDNEPDIFQKTYKWLDVKDYLILRCTGNYGMTQDSAHITFLYDTRPGRIGWHKGLCRMFDVDMNHLPPVVQSTDVVGSLTVEAAAQMSLNTGTPVFGGGGDASLTTIGAGCMDLYDTHIYVGTSGWVISNVKKRMVDVTNYIASILGSLPDRYNYIAEQETSGACLQWVRDHLAQDDIGVYLDSMDTKLNSNDTGKLYDLLNKVVDETPPGSDGVIFTPWLHGNRAPREDAYARGMFFNIGINTGKRKLIRAVLEGVAFHKRWMLEAVEKKVPHQHKVRFVGGGAKSKVWCQIMADITGKQIETVENPQDVGTMGAAVVCGVGLGVFRSFEEAKNLIPAKEIYRPRVQYKEIYDKSFSVFKALYSKNKKLFKSLNKSDN